MLFALSSRSHDHIFRLVLRPKTAAVILWSSIEDILAQALTTCLVNIQQFSKDDPNALIYFGVNQNSLVGGIRSAVMYLHQNEVSTMVSEFMASFHRFINSNAEMPLDNTFEVYFHVASAKDPNRPSHRRKAIPLRTLVGSGDEHVKFLMPGSLIDLPTGSPANPECFKDACLLASLAYSIIQLRKPLIYAKVKQLLLRKSTVAKKNEAASLLIDEINYFCNQSKLPRNGPHDLTQTIEAFYKVYNVQITVILSMKGSKPEYISQPTQYSASLPRLYFLLKKNNYNADHVYIIQSIATFFQTYRRAICFFCKSFHYTGFGTSKNSRHKCRSLSSCQKCFGIYKAVDTWVSNNEPWCYCDLKLSEPELPKTCSKCGVNFQTQICFNNHLRFCDQNTYYWQCMVCQKSVSMLGRDIRVIEENHKCNQAEKYCPTCIKPMPTGHICAISKAEKTAFWPNLGVLSLMFQDVDGAQCHRCYAKQAEFMSTHGLNYKQLLQSDNYYKLSCSRHENVRTNVPNVIKLFYEKERFNFCGETFSDNNFLVAAVPLSENFNVVYCDSPFPKKSNCSSRKRKRVNFDLCVSGPLTAINQMLNFFVAQKLQNYTFLIQTNQEMLFLLQVFLDNFWHPTVVQSGRVVKKINIADLDLTFLLFENYCKGTLSELLKQFEIQRTLYYFPWAFNQKDYYAQVISKPDFSYFQSFSDTAVEKAEKLAFYSTLPANIDVNALLLRTISENLKSFLLCVTSFVRLCFELQGLLSNVTKNPEKNPCHPFDPKIISISAFSMAILKFYYLNNYPIKTVLKPYTGCAANVSSSEYEYLSFMSNLKPEEKIRHAFNHPDGQKKFDYVLVDGYASASQTVYQFYGCQVRQCTTM